jgi:hypothetical protein
MGEEDWQEGRGSVGQANTDGVNLNVAIIVPFGLAQPGGLGEELFEIHWFACINEIYSGLM